MFEYDTSHVSTSSRNENPQCRHGIARKTYVDRKTARVLGEDALRRKADRLRLVSTYWPSIVGFAQRVARALLLGSDAEAGGRR